MGDLEHGGGPTPGVSCERKGGWVENQLQGLARSITITRSLLEMSGAVPGAWAEVGGLGTAMSCPVFLPPLPLPVQGL